MRYSLATNQRHAKPGLELLEDRFLLSVAITDLGVLPGYTESYATAINASGQVVGYSDNYSSTNPNSTAHAFLYSKGQMTDLGTLPGVTGGDSFAYGINDSGQVVGYSETIGTNNALANHAYLYSNGQMTDLGTLPGDTDSGATGINDLGQIVGSSGTGHAFLYSNGKMINLGTLPGDTEGSAYAINASGQVVGDSDKVDGYVHAFLYSNGQLTSLGSLPGDTNSVVTGINASGQVVGYSYQVYVEQPGPGHPFLYSNGHMTNLGALLPGPSGAVTDSGPTGVNDLGQVVGIYQYLNVVGDSDKSSPFLYSNGQILDLNTLLPANSGWVLTDATAINDAGQIVGTGTINGQAHAFLLNLNAASPPASPPVSPPQSLPPPPPIGGVGGSTVGEGVNSPTFFQAAITLYIDGVERIFQGDSATLELSIQSNLPYAVFAGIDFGGFFVLAGELAAYNVLQGNNNDGHS